MSNTIPTNQTRSKNQIHKGQWFYCSYHQMKKRIISDIFYFGHGYFMEPMLIVLLYVFVLWSFGISISAFVSFDQRWYVFVCLCTDGHGKHVLCGRFDEQISTLSNKSTNERIIPRIVEHFVEQMLRFASYSFWFSIRFAHSFLALLFALVSSGWKCESTECSSKSISSAIRWCIHKGLVIQ